MHRRAALAAASSMVLGLTWPALVANAQPDRFGQYETLVDRYRSGARAQSVAELGKWQERDVRAVVLQAAGQEWAKLPAALLLHTDLVLQLHSNVVPDFYDLHVSAALTLERALRRTSDGMALGARWFLATGLQHAEATGALSWWTTAAKAHPDDPYLLLALGSLEESFISFGTVHSRRAALRAEAESHLRRALKLDDSLHEGRVRLAHLLMGRGDDDKALAELDVVLGRSREHDQLYLAHLFQGRVREHQGRMQQALDAYTAAAAVDERWQTAHIAISQARWRMGNASGALTELHSVVVPKELSAGNMDPWWVYPWVQRWRADALLEALRKEVSR
jgi:tetratricopeptide (TPR) repeat protein